MTESKVSLTMGESMRTQSGIFAILGLIIGCIGIGFFFDVFIIKNTTKVTPELYFSVFLLFAALACIIRAMIYIDDTRIIFGEQKTQLKDGSSQ